MTTARTECEAAFEGTGAFDPRWMRRLRGVGRLREAPAEERDALYYDTDDLRLRAHGVTLCRTDGGPDAGWHARLPADGGADAEVRRPARAGAADRVPPGLDPWLTAYTRGRPLRPVAHLRTHRRRHLLLDGKDRLLAEVAESSVAAQVLGAQRWGTGVPEGDEPRKRSEPSDGGGTAVLTHWSEIDVEIAGGPPALLDDAARELAAMGWHRSPSARGLDRALADALPPAARPREGARPERRRAGSAGEAVMNRLDEQAEIVLRLDPRVRGDEPDAVHSLRTAARRIRNLLRSHRGLLDRARSDPVAGELAWLTSVLAGPRDHEVLAHRLRRDAARLAEAPAARAGAGAGDGLAPLRRAAVALEDLVPKQERERHDMELRSALDALESPRYFALLDALDALRADPPLRDGARRPALKELRRAARRDHGRLRRRVAAALAAPAGPERDLALHAARKAVRRVRHTAETAVPYAGKPAERLRRHAKALQQVLGDHQDAVVARGVLPELAEEAHRRGRNAFGYGLLYARQDDLARRAERRLPGVWRKAGRRGLTRLR